NLSPLHRSLTTNDLDTYFNELTRGQQISTDPLIICDRPINIIKQAKKIVWFDFQNICGRPRSHQDYLELAKQYRTVLVSNIPIIETHQKDLIISFIHLVDVLYDAGIQVLIAAKVPIEMIYPEGQM